MKFVDRIKELDFLNNLYKSKGFHFVPIYGRRRIGKTRLAQEFIRNKKAIYFLADSVSESEQLKNLAGISGEYFKDFMVGESGFKDWHQCFRYIKEKTNNERFIIIIDEFPYLVNSNPAISTVFQKIIDENIKETNLFLILMGSSIGMMEKEVLFYKAPLYGRRTASLEVKEIPFVSLKEFFPNMNFDELVRIFSVFGTVPAYIEKINPKDGIFSNIERLLLDKGTFFYNEVEFILREELREPRNYFVILKAIAEGKRKLSEIINETGFEKSLVSRYIDIVKNLRFIEKELPVTEKYPEKSKKGLYKLNDKFFTFWFRYIFPNKSRIEIGRPQYVLKLINESFEHYVSMNYEDICIDLCKDFMSKGLMEFTLIGRWWEKNEEIDIVAIDEDKKICYFCECKWTNKKIGEDIYKELIRKSALVDWNNKNRTDKFALFSKSGFTDAMIDTAKRDEVMLVHKDKIV